MESRAKWLQEHVVPAVLDRNWPGGKIVNVELGTRQGGNATDGGFASSTFRLVLRVKQQDQEESEHHLIAKVCFDNPALREMFSSEKQFENELGWYYETIPAFETLDANNTGASLSKQLSPRCLLCHKESAELNVIVMQDLKYDGFELARQPAASLDTVHAGLALERLGQLHALGYTLKHKRPEIYRKCIQNIHETVYKQDFKIHRDPMLLLTIKRGLDPLRNQVEYAEVVSAVERSQGDSPYEMQMALIHSRNSATDVLCHGDFCRNNVLYQYNSDGAPIDSKLIDFATMRESSPGADLSFFLYMSVSEEAIEGSGFRQLLSRYHSGLISALKQLDGPPDPWHGDLEALEREVGRYALFAYCICSFFLPVMMVDGASFSIEDLVNVPPEEQNRRNLEMGGEIVTQRIANILRDS
ncbi:hypothetical protein B566_EDAN003602 [Ephemera danica]|nr:hypothetical protein B566_EDAN003602 [Ephemera danica]